MVIEEIIWVERFEWKIWCKHHVTRDEVEDIFNSNPQFFFVEKGDCQDENLYLAAGQTRAGRFLVVWFVYKRGKNALPISARQMTPQEKRRYGKKKK
jgi:uncharacterized DUF497 family protein